MTRLSLSISVCQSDHFYGFRLNCKYLSRCQAWHEPLTDGGPVSGIRFTDGSEPGDADGSSEVSVEGQEHVGVDGLVVHELHGQFSESFNCFILNQVWSDLRDIGVCF